MKHSSFQRAALLRQNVPLRAGVQNPKHRFQEPDASERGYGPDGHRECSPPENPPGCVPIPNQAVEISTFYSGSTSTLNFEIGSSQIALGCIWLNITGFSANCSAMTLNPAR
jgi:hypothetical protein